MKINAFILMEAFSLEPLFLTINRLEGYYFDDMPITYTCTMMYYYCTFIYFQKHNRIVERGFAYIISNSHNNSAK